MYGTTPQDNRLGLWYVLLHVTHSTDAYTHDYYDCYSLRVLAYYRESETGEL